MEDTTTTTNPAGDADQTTTEDVTTTTDDAQNNGADTDTTTTEDTSTTTDGAEGGDEAKDEAVEFDPEKFKQELTETIVEKLTLKLAGKTIDEVKDDSDTVPPWEKENRNPTYKELADYLRDNVKKDLKSEDEAKTKAEAEEAKKLEEANKQYNDHMNTYWDNQLQELETANKIDKSEREELQRQWLDYMVNAKKANKSYTVSLKEFFYEGYKKKDDQPAGADAPVGAGKQSVSSGKAGDFTYEEVHNTSIEDIIAGK